MKGTERFGPGMLDAREILEIAEHTKHNIDMAAELQKEVDAMDAVLREMKLSIARLALDVMPSDARGDDDAG